MRMSKGVEWALHTLINLDVIGGGPMHSGRLAEAHGLSPSYLTKQLQQLAQAGLVSSVSGPHGGFRLARALEDITLLDVVEAIEGDVKAFHCTEIRCEGKIGALSPPPTRTCAVHAAMRRAEDAWRQALAAQTLAGIRADLNVTPAAARLVRKALD
ncbi:RrF2 family transcriptional regulator [Streptomyces sp. NPDC018026]|uniref:RrF2 family transcriptional regulator n=1 Tax=Streptomyces sp. NPDC018026 TaxID=3365031 RepID=UPI0037A61DED